MRRMGGEKILIAYPSIAIKNSWIDEFKKCDYDYENVTFTTYKSLYKHVDEEYDLAIFDEIHSLSRNQMDVVSNMSDTCMHTLGLTGTLNEYTERDLMRYTGFRVLGTYSIEEAVRDGVISDYEIRVVEVPLDKDNGRKVYSKYGKPIVHTEASKYISYTKVIDKMREENQDDFFMQIKRMHLLRDSISKEKATKKLVDYHMDRGDRLLVFCPTTKMADNLGIASYHSKSTEKDMLEKFSNGDIDYMASCKMLTAGVTMLPLKVGIINSVDSNSENFGQKIARFLNLEYEDKAIIYIVTSTTETEKRWVKRALEFLDPTKVIWNYKLGEVVEIS